MKLDISFGDTSETGYAQHLSMQLRTNSSWRLLIKIQLLWLLQCRNYRSCPVIFERFTYLLGDFEKRAITFEPHNLS